MSVKFQDPDWAPVPSFEVWTVALSVAPSYTLKPMAPEDKPFVDAQIIAVPADPKMRARFDLMQKATADSQGRFRLRGLRPGEYLLMALEDAEEQPFADDPFLKQYADKIQKIKVEASTQQVKLQTITMEK